MCTSNEEIKGGSGRCFFTFFHQRNFYLQLNKSLTLKIINLYAQPVYTSEISSACDVHHEEWRWQISFKLINGHVLLWVPSAHHQAGQ
jgi:hypothetical protein